MPLPADIQSALIKRILPYDKSLAGGQARLLVVFDSEPKELVDELIAAFESAGLATAGGARPAELEARADDFEVLYVLPSAVSSKLEDFCSHAAVLTISGHPELAERGDASIGLGIHQGKPRILVHPDRLELEGHQLSSDLLRYATLVGSDR